MVEPISLTSAIAVANVGFQIVQSEPFQKLLEGVSKGVGTELGRSAFKSITVSSSKTNSNDNELLKSYIAQDLSNQERALSAQKDFSKKLLNLLGNWHRKENENSLRQIQNDWDKDNWFSKLDRQETQQILQQSRHSLLILASPANISPDCPDSLRNNLQIDINTHIPHISKYY